MPLPISPIFYLGKRFKIIPLPTQAKKGISVASLHIPNPFEHFYFINKIKEGSGDKEGIKVKPSLNYQLGLENPFLPIFMSEPIGQLQVGGSNIIIEGNEYRPPESVPSFQPQIPIQPQTPIQPQSGGVIGIPYTGSGSGTGTQYSGGDIVRIPPPTVPYSPTFAPTKQDISLTPTGTPTPTPTTTTTTTTTTLRREGIFM